LYAKANYERFLKEFNDYGKGRYFAHSLATNRDHQLPFTKISDEHNVLIEAGKRKQLGINIDFLSMACHPIL